MRATMAVLACMLIACDDSGPTSEEVGNTRIALNDLGTRTYLGFTGGLYPDGSNAPPGVHAQEGVIRARRIQPRAADGTPSPAGKFVLLSIGMSNTTQEFCSAGSGLPCDSWSFMGKAAADPAVNHSTLVIVNGAMGGQTASTWDEVNDPIYQSIRISKLTPLGLSEQQVQIVWVKVAQAGPTDSLPSQTSDAYQLVREHGEILRALKLRYPNVQQVFMSSRIYAGYATTALNPEPYAYQSGFAVKWTIEAQIREMMDNVVDARAGSLNYNTVAPWAAWGPYLWADGLRFRSDGLAWASADFANDGTHPSQSGREKVANQLMNFFKTSSFTSCWFLAGRTC